MLFYFEIHYFRKMNEPDLYAYTDYVEYLNDWFAFHKAKSKGFSFASFSRRAGFKSRSFIQLILKGERNISSKSLFQMIQGLQLGDKDALFFEALVDFKQAPTDLEKELHWKKVRQLGKGSPQAKLRSQEFDFFKNWYLAPLREIICNLKIKVDSPLDAQALGALLNPSVSARKITEGLEILQSLNLMVPDQDHCWTHSEQHVQASALTQSLAVRQFQKDNHKLAQESLDRFKRNERNISTITLGTNEEGFQQLNDLVQEFQQNVIKIVEQQDEVQKVFQLNLQLFPVSHQIK